MSEYEEGPFQGNAPILFLHGLGASRWMWWQQEKAFPDYPIIMADLPGHGNNAATSWKSLADTTDFIARHAIQNRKVHVVGISLGGHVALELAKHHPENILSAFITGITAEPMSFQFLLKVQSRFVQRGIRNERYLNRMARGYYRLPPYKITEFITNYQLLTRETYERIFKEIMEFRLDSSYEVISCPCLVVAGSKESRAIVDSIDIAPRFIPAARGMLIPDAKHAWPVQKADLFNQTLRKWLDSRKAGIGFQD